MIRGQPRTVPGPGSLSTEASSGAPDWKRPEDYEALAQSDRRAFAWEWLRRTRAYRDAWEAHVTAASDSDRSALNFGLERFEDPARGAPDARPVWSGTVDPAVVRVRPASAVAAADDRLDLYRLGPWVTLGIGEDGNERVLLSDGRNFVRIDVIEGTLIGCPSSVIYLIEGAVSARDPLTTVIRLLDLIARRRFTPVGAPRSQKRERWIRELRVADALTSGAKQQDIARVLFGSNVASSRWRVQSNAYRRRVQRLVDGARQKLQRPIDSRWFVSPAHRKS